MLLDSHDEWERKGFLLNRGDERNELCLAYGTLINLPHAINQQQREM